MIFKAETVQYAQRIFSTILGFFLLSNPAFAVEFKCIGHEKGVNSLTGKERVIPVSYNIEILKNSAILKEFKNTKFIVDEDGDSFILKASLVGKTRVIGGYTIQINKRTGQFTGKSWLFSRENITLEEGKCEKVSGSK